MIISRQKEFKELLGVLKEQDIFIIGCGKCATKLHVGGETEVLEMEKRLTLAGKSIAGRTVLSSVCSISSWEDVLSQNPGIKRAEALLAMSCGAGASMLSKLAGRQVYPALDTESLGGTCRDEVVGEQCGACGACTSWVYGGLCPVAQCAKGLLNGPCGGALDGKCEVEDRTCAWDEIFDRLKKLRKLEYLEAIREPKDHSKRGHRG